MFAVMYDRFVKRIGTFAGGDLNMYTIPRTYGVYDDKAEAERVAEDLNLWECTRAWVEPQEDKRLRP